jgi:hypothetical protein
MFRSKTLLVLGAGASAEVSLPIGNKLLDTICDTTDFKFEHFNRQVGGNPMILEALKLELDEGDSVQRLNEHIESAHILRKAAVQALSIDNLVHSLENEDVERIAKIAIVHGIHKAEENSREFKRSQKHPFELPMENFRNSWFSYFTKLLCEGVKKSEVDNIFENLEIVNFNYDRCIEQYLPDSISDALDLPIDKCRELVDSLLIHRPYGFAGKLPWQSSSSPEARFGGEDASVLVKCARNIQTFTEGVQSKGKLQEIRNSVHSAKRIVFLGFAFHRQNLELLSVGSNTEAQVLATVDGISKNDQKVIEREIATAIGIRRTRSAGQITLAEIRCREFFEDNWRTLTS